MSLYFTSKCSISSIVGKKGIVSSLEYCQLCWFSTVRPLCCLVPVRAMTFGEKLEI